MTLYYNNKLKKGSTAANSIGYKQALELIERRKYSNITERDFKKFLSEFKGASRSYATSQHTWFRKERWDNYIFYIKPVRRINNSGNYISTCNIIVFKKSALSRLSSKVFLNINKAKLIN